MKTFLFFLFLFSAINVDSYAQCRIFNVQHNYKGIDVRFYKMIVSENKLLYLHTQKKESKRVGNIQVDIPFNFFSWHYDTSKKRITEQRQLENGKLLVSEFAPDSLHWVVTNESKKILGYQCYKAILPAAEAEKLEVSYQEDGDLIVWFTPEIPISAGPERIYGLPGLIMEFTFSAFPALVYTVVSEEVQEKKTEDCIKIPSDGIPVELATVRKIEHSSKEIKSYEKKSK